jgi:hypothetical protein
MTPAAFCQWLEDMRYAKIAMSQAACADLLGLSTNAVSAMKVRGADKRTALACRALLHRLEPYR